MNLIIAELADAWRQLRRAPGFSLFAIGLLATGLGATTAIFSLAYAIVLRPLPFGDPSRLVGFRATNTLNAVTQDGHSLADFRDYAARGRSFSAITAYRPNFVAYTRSDASPVRLVTSLVTEDFFNVLGVQPRLGRVFRPDEFSVSAARAVVISDAAWHRLFDASPNAVGGVILLDDEPHIIIGVMSPEFREPEFVDAWLAFPREAPENLIHDSRFWSIVGRLRPDSTPESAEAELNGIAADLARQFPESNRGWSTHLMLLHEQRTRGMRAALGLLTGAVGLVLTIACLNLANLLLARGLSRTNDLALRLALGAKPGQLARRVLLESTLLALFGGIAGCGLAAVTLRILVNRIPSGLIPRSHEVALHPPAVAFAMVISLGTGLLFGLLPALQVFRADVAVLLKNGGARGSSGVSYGRIQQLLVAGQVTLSFVVLVAALLLMKSLVALQNVDPGFSPHEVLTLRLAPPVGRYESNLELARYYERLITEVSAVPGVSTAGVNASAPFCGVSLQFPFWVHGRPRGQTGADEAVYAPVSDDFFTTLRLPVRDGRTFTARDSEKAEPVAIINETLARRVFPGQNPIGQRVLLMPWLSNEYREIVGVVGDSRQTSLASPPPAQIYVPQRQMPWFFSTLLVRLERTDAMRAVEAAVRRVDPTLPFTPNMLEDSIGRGATQPRLYAVLFGVFAVIALGLSALGIYASMSFTTGRRTREIGIRMALGSTPAEIIQLILWSACRLTAWGLGIGIVAALALSSLLRGLLYGVQPSDPWVYAALVMLIPLVALGSALPTALRAARLPPIQALQHE